MGTEARLAEEVADRAPGRVVREPFAKSRLLRLDRMRGQAQRFDLGVAGNAAGAGKAVGDRGHLGFISSLGGPRRFSPHRDRRVCHRVSGLTIWIPVDKLWGKK